MLRVKFCISDTAKLLTRVISHGSNIIYALGERVHKASTLSGCNDRPTQRILFVKTEEVSLRKEGRESIYT